ncbi:uncharacterized mitochondrial protein AtMg00810-like [Rutidosis leptorrhynchoides]|uniref:uncharacterized mitochondrial protein AtMg00810-like n=1 Tax=Rutidosis leptorrhynchoides TaxID=125765 RepID=UPI003A98FCB1
MTNLGQLNFFLGISVTRIDSGMFLSKKKYKFEILERVDMLNYKPFRTPVDIGYKLTSNGPHVANPTLYHSLAVHDSREPHLSALKRILRYVRGTLDLGLQLFASSLRADLYYTEWEHVTPVTMIPKSANELFAYIITTRHSTSGYCVFLSNNLSSWSSKRQNTPSRSSAEYLSVANTVAKT